MMFRETWERDVAYNQGRHQDDAETPWVEVWRWRRRFWLSILVNLGLGLALWMKGK